MRMQQMKAQLDALTSLSSGDSSSGILATASTGRVAKSTDRLKLTKLTESDDVKAYFTTFEQMMAVHKIKEDCWAIKLAPQLTGKALLAYAAMGAEAASNNLEVKKAILKQFGINEESYRQQFRVAKLKEGEAYGELLIRLGDLFNKWMIECKSIADVKEKVVVEQLVSGMPRDL